MPCKGKCTCCMFIGVENQQSKSYPSYMQHTYLSSYMSLQKIIKLPQTVWQLWPSQDFGIRGDNYIMERGWFGLAKVLCILRHRGHPTDTGLQLGKACYPYSR